MTRHMCAVWLEREISTARDASSGKEEKNDAIADCHFFFAILEFCESTIVSQIRNRDTELKFNTKMCYVLRVNLARGGWCL